MTWELWAQITLLMVVGTLCLIMVKSADNGKKDR